MDIPRVRKAVIPAAGHGTRLFPATKAVKKEFFPVVDREGVAKPAIQLIVEEVLEAGMEEICIIVQPGDRPEFERYFSGTLPPDFDDHVRGKDEAVAMLDRLRDYGERISYAVQETQEGFGHAVYCAREFVGDEPFLLLLGDHIYVSHTEERCAAQLLNVYRSFGGSVTSVYPTPAEMLYCFGTVGGRRISHDPLVYELSHIKEKPTPKYAREHFIVEGMPDDTYLGFFGQHLLMPEIFDSIRYHMDNGIREKGEIQLTNAMEHLRQAHGAFHALAVKGERYDIGIPSGYVETLARLSGSPR